VLTIGIGIIGLLSAYGVVDIINKFSFIFTEFDVKYHLEVIIVFILGSLLSILSIFAVKFNLYVIKKKIVNQLKNYWIGNLLFGFFLTLFSVFLLISTINSEAINPKQKVYNFLFLLLFLVISFIVLRDSYNWKKHFKNG